MRTLLFACVVGCTGASAVSSSGRAIPRLPELPSHGGPPWVEVTSPHFVVWTDTPEARGRELVREMEHHRQVVAGVALGGQEPKQKTLVLALRDASEVAVYVPAQFIAYSWSSSPIWQPVIVVAADTDEDHRHIFTHELTHVITRSIVPNQPAWFAEGIAGYFETARIDTTHGTVDVGEPLDYIAERLRYQHPTSVAAMIACTEHACMDEMFYATAWAMFAFLANVHPDLLARYMQKLTELPRDHEGEAWAAVLPAADVFDHELAAWLAHGRHTVMHYKAKLTDPEPAARPLGEGDVLASRGLLRWLIGRADHRAGDRSVNDAARRIEGGESAAPAAAGPGDEPGRAEIDAALAADPTNLIARILLVATTHEASVPEARATAMAHPDDWRAWWLLGHAARRGPDAIEARSKLCALVGNALPEGIPPSFCASL